ncbi:hypothetical protein IB238_19865 [Rhizobium sp. ARZ01]|uniref:hypothetical protein n=1 Tax=Rhizobium sp. ARZ01 TaxID=2769313 RepID=UPI0017858D1D|nr:hypothetical protein [Rhizobium sp. ARZ01]MBD9374887.1 hypothetical protein [Rhizobium sp. ARZ01]
MEKLQNGPDKTKYNAVPGALGDWLGDVDKRGFEIDEIALKVSRRTPVGSAIMDADLFNDLCTFVDDYRRGRKAGSAL